MYLSSYLNEGEELKNKNNDVYTKNIVADPKIKSNSVENSVETVNLTLNYDLERNFINSDLQIDSFYNSIFVNEK
jgi:hypothetical protein